jgi:succinate dehydrogenase/fumarate reductase flavoprotein subunit
MKISDQTSISMPMRNLLSIVAAVGIGVYSYFGIVERLNNIETQGKLMLADVQKNTEFRIKWPRGEMGSLPADAQQDLLLEFMAQQVEAMQEEMESMMSNTVNIKRSQQDIERLIGDVEKLKDKLRESNGSY